MKSTSYRFGILAASMVALGCNGGPDVPEPLKPLALADTVILYSIDGNRYQPGEEPKTAEKFGDYPAFGEVELSQEARAEVIGALVKGLNTEEPAKCFWPRHVLRAIKGETAVDYVICFECNQTSVFADGKRTKLRISKDAQSALDKHLTAAGIPLAPK